jgi:hypothetical protein
MRTDTAQDHGAINNILLPGAILLANIDVTGLLEYAMKAAAGGAIWFAYKMAAELVERRRKRSNAKSRTRSRKVPKKMDNGINQ